MLHDPLSWNHFKMTGGAYDVSVSIERSRYHMCGPVRFTWRHSSRRRVPGLLRVTEFTFFVKVHKFYGGDALVFGVGQFLPSHLHGHLHLHSYLHLRSHVHFIYMKKFTFSVKYAVE